MNYSKLKLIQIEAKSGREINFNSGSNRLNVKIRQEIHLCSFDLGYIKIVEPIHSSLGMYEQRLIRNRN